MELRESLKAKIDEGEAYISEIEVTFISLRTQKLDMCDILASRYVWSRVILVPMLLGARVDPFCPYFSCFFLYVCNQVSLS
jgi:hypothetical protein